jgi:hypothetical protein
MSQYPLPGHDDPIVGSTLTPSAGVSPKFITNELQANILTLKSNSATDITHDPNSQSPEEIPSMLAISRKFGEIIDLYIKAEELLNKFSNPYVISDPLCDPHFLDRHWDSDNVSFDNGRATIVKRTTNIPYAYLKITATAFTIPGWHYCEVEISSMSPGTTIEVRTEKNTLVKTITSAGVYKFRYIVERPSTSVLYFNVTKLADNGEIVLESVYLHSVRASLNRYMVFIQEEAETGGSGYASMDQVLAACLNTLNDAKLYTSQLVSNLNVVMDSHIQDTLNPHQTTYTQVGAAATVHTHIPSECGAAAEHHTHTSADIELEGINLSELRAHLIDTDNHYHQVTKEQVGLGNLPNATTDLANEDTSNKLATGKAVATVNTNLATHASNYDNPHMTTAEQVGLGNVNNYATATLEEHIDGTLDTRYTHPLGVKSALTAWTNSGVDISKMQPQVLYELVISAETSQKIPLIPNKIYQIHISTGEHTGIGNFKFNFEDENGDVVGPYKNGFVYVTPDVAPHINWKLETHDYMTMVPDPYGVNFGRGTITINTESFLVTSEFLGMITDTSTSEFLNEPIIPTKMYSTIHKDTIYELVTTTQTIKTLNLVNDETTGSMLVTIYEMMPVHTHPTVVVDATPVGQMASTLSINPVQPGWSYIDGSELSRINYQKLYDYAVSQNLIISQMDWDTMNSNGEDIPHFGDGDGSSTFCIPKIQDLTQPWILNVIKVREVSLPNDTQVLFHLIKDEQNNP